MRILIMDGSAALRPALEASLKQVFPQAVIDTVRADQIRFSGCAACDVCSWKTPGICAHPGLARDIARFFAQADLCVLVTGLSSGAPQAASKALWEHILPVVHPGFVRYRGELHHRLRYPRLPGLLFVAESAYPAGDPHSEFESAIFASWAERAACNTMSHAASLIVPAGQAPDTGRLNALLNDLARCTPAQGDRLPPLSVPGLPDPADPGQQSPLLILAASGRKNSNSLAIARWLANQTFKDGLEAQVVDSMTTAPDETGRRILDAGQLFVIAPTWHDALPASTIRLLEQLAASGASAGRGRPLFALVHSGYPEPAQTATALASLRFFALEHNWHWAGGMTAGATSIIDGRDLTEAGFFTRNLRQGLALAAADLAAGRAISSKAVRAAARPPLPGWLFASAGNMMVKKRIRQLRAAGIDPDARPYLASGTETGNSHHI